MSKKAKEHAFITGLLKAFFWMDDGLQNYLKSLGWPTLTRTQSMVMMNVISGSDKPSQIARNLGISRQAIHLTITQMIDAGLLRLEQDSADRRSKKVVLTPEVEPMRRDARQATEVLIKILGGRFGSNDMSTLINVFCEDWGNAPTFQDGKMLPVHEAPPAERRRARQPSNSKKAKKASR